MGLCDLSHSRHWKTTLKMHPRRVQECWLRPLPGRTPTPQYLRYTHSLLNSNSTYYLKIKKFNLQYWKLIWTVWYLRLLMKSKLTFEYVMGHTPNILISRTSKVNYCGDLSYSIHTQMWYWIINKHLPSTRRFSFEVFWVPEPPSNRIFRLTGIL